MLLGYLKMLNMANKLREAVVSPLRAEVLDKVALGIMCLVWVIPVQEGCG